MIAMKLDITEFESFDGDSEFLRHAKGILEGFTGLNYLKFIYLSKRNFEMDKTNSTLTKNYLLQFLFTLFSSINIFI